MLGSERSTQFATLTNAINRIPRLVYLICGPIVFAEMLLESGGLSLSVTPAASEMVRKAEMVRNARHKAQSTTKHYGHHSIASRADYM
jgi:hypothetical protein